MTYRFWSRSYSAIVFVAVLGFYAVLAPVNTTSYSAVNQQSTEPANSSPDVWTCHTDSSTAIACEVAHAPDGTSILFRVASSLFDIARCDCSSPTIRYDSIIPADPTTGYVLSVGIFLASPNVPDLVTEVSVYKMPSRSSHKDKETDVDDQKIKERSRHKSSKSSRKDEKSSSSNDKSSSAETPSKSRRKPSTHRPDLERRSSSSPTQSKNNLPYPAFSKAHSKEAIGRKDSVSIQKEIYHTPDPTDLTSKDKEIEEKLETRKGVTPPSPPETTLEQRKKLEAVKVDTVKVERKRTDLQKAAEDLKRRLSKERNEDRERSRRKPSHSSRTRRIEKEDTDINNTGSVSSPKTSKPGTPSKLRPRAVTVEDAGSSTSFKRATSSVQSGKSEGTTDSDATSIAANQEAQHRRSTSQAKRDSSPATEPDSSGPITPTPSEPQIRLGQKEASVPIPQQPSPSAVIEESPMPPPPPPAPSELPVPKVDYLLQHGGLTHTVHRSLLAASSSWQPSTSSPDTKSQAESFFGPFKRVLDDYCKVISKKGSVAVATGYRSVARRLLDRLEAVFARDISSESCLCEMCQGAIHEDAELDDKRSVSWGEILEYVCGRQDLPKWPPFVFEHGGLGISMSEQVTPMQNLDIDVPDEFREHYVRQSKRTKQAVDKWLQTQPEELANLPSEVDDETLTFAMLTRLDPEQRTVFSRLLGVPASRPTSTCSVRSLSHAATPPTSEVLQKTGLAVQRLYRLPRLPRDPEAALYLLHNPSLHNVLVTLAAISDGEWDILTSGRFDGFLRSGAEDDIATPTASSVPPPFSRNASQSYNILSRPATANNIAHSGPLDSSTIPPSRGLTPFSTRSPSAGAPVALDEETEIAALAEVEREIFLSMEALEDAFESLHVKAEGVRCALRERGAGLAQANQNRRAGTRDGIVGADSRFGTPAAFLNRGADGISWETETDDGIDDGVSELAPDDSASNVSRSRVRRPKRRNERRTPAPVEEEDEDVE